MRSMDKSKPVTTNTAVPARDEAKARSANDGTRAGRNTAYSRDAGAGPSNVGGRGGHAKPVHSKGVVRSFPYKVRSGQAQTGTARGPNAAGTGGVVGTSMPKQTHKPPLPNPGESAPTGTGMPKPSGEGVPGDGKCNLSKRQKRRIIARERAHTLAQAPGVQPSTSIVVTEVGHNKRPLGSSGDSALLTSAPKRTRVGSYAEAVVVERMAIIPVGYPVDKMVAGHLAAVQSAVLAAMDSAPDPLPTIAIGNIVGGALHVNCKGRGASTWLSATIGGMTIGGLSLKVVDAKDLPKPVKMAWKTRIVGVQDVKLMLRVLQRFNPGIHTEHWKVVDTVMSEASTRRIILMDRESADVIKASNYQLNSGVDLSSFKLLEDVEDRRQGGARADPRMPGVVETAAEGDVNPMGGTDPEDAAANVQGDEAPSKDVAESGTEAAASAAAMVEGPWGEGRAMAGMGRESSPLSTVDPEDLRAMADLYLDGDGIPSPMSGGAPAEEAAEVGSPNP